MKLLVKTSLYFLFFSIPAIVIAGGFCYFLLLKAVEGNNKDFFKKEKGQIKNYIEHNDTLSLRLMLLNSECDISRLKPGEHVVKRYNDTLVYDSFEKELVDVYMLTTELKTTKGSYRLKLWRSTLDSDEMMTSVLSLITVVLVFLLLIIFIVNWWIAGKVWKPFYSTLEKLRTFSASNPEKETFLSSSTDEFKKLNQSVGAMMDKMHSDFISQKQFTENASHEMQTPLAVIKAQVELLIQSNKIGVSESELITRIDTAATKLSRLNKSLLLLTKIENHQFLNDDNVSLNKIIAESISLFEEHVLEKEIVLTVDTHREISIKINPDLCFVLINNLLQNAIRHNLQNGKIEIKLEERKLTISNTGIDKPLDVTKVFERFQKNPFSAESLGLGLAIAKEIADVSGLTITYQYVDNMHQFGVLF